jgi:hypothetical protein
VIERSDFPQPPSGGNPTVQSHWNSLLLFFVFSLKIQISFSPVQSEPAVRVCSHHKEHMIIQRVVLSRNPETPQFILLLLCQSSLPRLSPTHLGVGGNPTVQSHWNSLLLFFVFSLKRTHDHTAGGSIPKPGNSSVHSSSFVPKLTGSDCTGEKAKVVKTYLPGIHYPALARPTWGLGEIRPFNHIGIAHGFRLYRRKRDLDFEAKYKKKEEGIPM